MTVVLRKITEADAGCWLDGHMGWHNAYRVVERAEAYGFTVPAEYREALDAYRASGDGNDSLTDDQWEAINGQGELSDMATDYLQARAPRGYEFIWDCGELSLTETCCPHCPDGCDGDHEYSFESCGHCMDGCC